jgi:Mn2+/Fe2+ NRAMP family transporter
MTSRIARFDGFARARYLRVAGQLTFGLWILGWLVFAVLIGIRASASLVSAVAALICILFTVSFVLQAASRRLAWRELRELIAREDLSSTRSRGLSRVRR